MLKQKNNDFKSIPWGAWGPRVPLGAHKADRPRCHERLRRIVFEKLVAHPRAVMVRVLTFGL